MIRNYTELGKAGEHRVISELLLRGHTPMLAIVDNGVDVVLENGTRLQVKTVSRLQKSHCGSACVTATHVGFENGKRVKKYIPHTADFFVVWVIPWQEFFIIPVIEVSKRKRSFSLARNYNKEGSLSTYRGRWDLLKGAA